MTNIRTLALNNYARVFCRKRLYGFHRALLSVAARGMGLFNSKDARLSGEAFFFEHIVSNRQLRVIFDVGANVGDFTQAVLSSNPTAAIYAFEPHPRTFAAFQATTEHNKRVVPFQCGLGTTASKAFLYDLAAGDGTQLASLHRGALEMISKDLTQVEVEIRTLDDVLLATGANRIDLLKIDTEGNERAVLLGASRALEEGRIRSVLFEFNEMNVFSRTFMHDFVELLPGFRFYRLLPDGLAALAPYSTLHSELYGFQNVFAVREDLHTALGL
jgi:FkbM family methyltransferase